MALDLDVLNPLGDGGIGATGEAGGAFSGKGNKNAFKALFSNPVFMQAVFALSAAGQNPFEVLGGFFSKDKPKGGKPGEYLKVGGQWLNVGSLASKLPEYVGMQEDAALKAQGATYDKLKDSPQFAGIFDEASGNYGPQFSADLDKAYTEMAGSVLGAGAASGFLLDPNKQAELLGPLALQKVQYLKAIQKNAEAQALGYSGAGYIPQNNPAGLLGAGTAGSYLPGLFQAGNLYQGLGMFNAQLGFQKQAQAFDNKNVAMGNVKDALGGALMFM